MLQDRLGDSPIISIEMTDLRCSSVTLNELLSALYMRISEEGL